jgi:S-adenosylmethionine:tRNA ribosyltransferase-isomerase
VYQKSTNQVLHQRFYDLPQFLRPGDLLIFNNTKVMPVRLFGKKVEGSAKIEVLLLKERSQNIWEALLRPGKKMHVGTHLAFEQTDTQAEVLEYLSEGVRILKFSGDVRALMESQGQLPVPPYIDSPLSPDQIKEKYQTVYASREGAVAAPTAGFHFTPELIKKLKEQGVQTAELTLHVGLGTFRPVQASDIREHPMHAERFELSQEVIDAIDRTKKQGGRVIAVGTTVTRVLEGLHKRDGKLNVGSGEINVFIYPGFEFKVIDGLITNFHQPQSTLLLLVAALVGEDWRKIYDYALQHDFRFLSYGDGSLLWKKKD